MIKLAQSKLTLMFVLVDVKVFLGWRLLLLFWLQILFFILLWCMQNCEFTGFTDAPQVGAE